MRKPLLMGFILALAACSDSRPPAPKVEAKPPAEAPAPVARAPEVKAPEAPKPDPNKELARRVKQALEGEAKIQAAAIDVTAADGKVTLWGTAASTSERNRAGQVAGKVDGVVAVDNQIKVVRGS